MPAWSYLSLEYIKGYLCIVWVMSRQCLSQARATQAGGFVELSMLKHRSMLSSSWLVFASGHMGPRKKSPPRTALRGGAGDLFFSTPPRAPFSLPPAKSLFRGPANCSQFRAGKANFRRMLSNKHTPDR